MSKTDAKEGVWPISFITAVFQSQQMPASRPLSSVTEGCMPSSSLSICSVIFVIFYRSNLTPCSYNVTVFTKISDQPYTAKILYVPNVDRHDTIWVTFCRNIRTVIKNNFGDSQAPRCCCEYNLLLMKLLCAEQESVVSFHRDVLQANW